ncbi:MAG: enoyl-CoA hydratase/isomerase family protein [Actinomycetota bacterium]
MMECVAIEVTEGVAVITMTRPPANAIDLQMGLELQGAVREAGERDDVGAIVITGGRTLFAAGADIKAMAEFSPAEIEPVVGALGDALDLLEVLPKISIAAVNGFALGGGFELALATDLRYLASDATVGQPEVNIGVIPGAGGTQRITQLAGAGVARELVYSGRMVPAEEALRLRLAEKILDPDAVLAAAIEDAARFAAGARGALAAAKAAIRAAVETPGTKGLVRERALFTELFGGWEQREGMRAFLEKRRPNFKS